MTELLRRKIHLSRALLLLFVITAFAGMNLSSFAVNGHYYPVDGYGWPVAGIGIYKHTKSLAFINGAALFLSVGIAALAIICAYRLSEHYIRRQERNSTTEPKSRFWQINWSTAVMFMVVAGDGILVYFTMPDKDERLVDAIISQDLESTIKLLGAGANVDAKSRDKMSYNHSPLHFACSVGNLKIIELLIKNGADVNASGSMRKRPLHCAGNRLQVIKLLMKNGAKIEATDHEGCTALHREAWWGHVDAVKLLSEYGANIDARDVNGWTPLFYVSHVREPGQEEVAALLIARGASVAAEDGYAQTPLHIAAQWNRVQIVEILLAAGANINAKRQDGLTPLDVAVEKNYESYAKLVQILRAAATR
jgi:ankyrin repeat protein